MAGPVGEALNMTALGLAVAIPAVLTYNAFVRRNRIWIAHLNTFSHDLFTLFTVGSQTENTAKPEQQKNKLRNKNIKMSFQRNKKIPRNKQRGTRNELKRKRF